MDALAASAAPWPHHNPNSELPTLALAPVYGCLRFSGWLSATVSHGFGFALRINSAPYPPILLSPLSVRVLAECDFADSVEITSTW